MNVTAKVAKIFPFRLPLQWRIAALKNGFQDTMAYRLDFIFEVLGYAIVPAAIQMVLWHAMFSTGGVTEVRGMSYHDLVSYTLTSVLFSQVRGGNHDFELQEMIRSGGLSQYLLRPVGVVEFTWIRGVAGKVLIAGVCLLVGVCVAAFVGYTPGRFVGGMFLALLGNIIHYQFGAILATAAFYWEEAFSILMVKNMVVDLLCGDLIPLNLFPDHLQWIWKSFPFYLYVYGPVQYSLGKWSHTEYLHQIGISLMWIAGGWVLIRMSWGFGMKRYLSLGG